MAPANLSTRLNIIFAPRRDCLRQQVAMDWLNRRILLCSGARYPDAVALWFYEVS